MEERIEALGEAIAAVAEGPLVTKWLVLAEVIDSDGDKTFQYFKPGELTAWDSMGLLNFQLTVEKRQIDIVEED